VDLVAAQHGDSRARLVLAQQTVENRVETNSYPHSRGVEWRCGVAVRETA